MHRIVARWWEWGSEMIHIRESQSWMMHLYKNLSLSLQSNKPSVRRSSAKYTSKAKSQSKNVRCDKREKH
ncbi:hypothetical protein EG68_04930 [Paragonimus skrjabini miyazakii]|uniref:Uncharacterized protein n=1 Tax=Paragonimus skrjabini miyazakii TaxID=59628 RepID=A0A8S9Z3J2_9TREM|nr:hypothetical protein EG68_04930 [Paragonimus skrjabini miyazakii]